MYREYKYIYSISIWLHRYSRRQIMKYTQAVTTNNITELNPNPDIICTVFLDPCSGYNGYPYSDPNLSFDSWLKDCGAYIVTLYLTQTRASVNLEFVSKVTNEVLCSECIVWFKSVILFPLRVIKLCRIKLNWLMVCTASLKCYCPLRLIRVWCNCAMIKYK